MDTLRIDGTELLDAMVTSVFLLDQDLHVTYLNAAAQTLLGLGPNQALGRSIAELTRGAAQLLERELLDPSLREYTRVIISEADRLTNLLDSMLGPGRPPSKQLINLHELLERVYHLLRSEAPESVAIDRDYHPSLPPLTLDPNHIIQAMLNLGRNAIQALTGAPVDSPRLILRTRAATNVSVGAHRHRLVASIQFEDNGPGVLNEIRETIFYPLVSGRADGSGLGLGIAQDLVSRHGGLIEFDSAPGRTIFVISLPMDTV